MIYVKNKHSYRAEVTLGKKTQEGQPIPPNLKAEIRAQCCTQGHVCRLFH